MALGCDGTEHGQQQAQMLDQHGGVLDTAAHQGAQRDLGQRQEHHQGQRGRGQALIEAAQPAGHTGLARSLRHGRRAWHGLLGHAHCPLPAR